MRANKLRNLLRAGKPSIGTRLSFTVPDLVEVIGHTGMYDYVEFLAEYNPYDLHDLDNLCRAVELFDMSAIIKIDQANRTYVAQRAIGSGFQGVLFTDSRSPEDVRECVRAVRPDSPGSDGLYGAAPRRFTFVTGGLSRSATDEYVQYLNDIVVVIMIEKEPAVEQLEEILSVPGVDMVQWGASDYSMSIGKPGRYQAAEVVAAGKKVFQTALRMGVQPRAEIGTVDQAKAFLDMGVRHFCIGYDLFMLYNWWKTQGDGLRKALEGH